MAAIVQTLTGDNRLQLGREDFVRPMQIGMSWTRLRIGVMFAVNGVNRFPNGTFLIGVCQGSVGFSDPNCTDFIGLTPFSYNAGVSDWVYNVGSSTYAPGANSPSMIQKIASSVTTTSTGISNSAACWATISDKRTMAAVELTKTDGNGILFRLLYPNTVAVPVDWSVNTFMQDLETETGPPNLTTSSLIPFTAVGSRLWDNVNIYWSKSAPTLEISTVAAIRFY